MTESNNPDYPEVQTAEPEATPPGPVTAEKRLSLIDVIRGIAVLGILMINIDLIALPSAVFFSPDLAGGFSGLDLLTWKFKYVVFMQKMMTIFAMLFGAGLILMYEKYREKGIESFAGIWYRRVFWLLVIGLIHAYFIWYGDILVPYAVCGLFLYPLRKVKARNLIILGSIILLIGAGIIFGTGELFSFMEKQYQVVQQAEETDETPDAMASQMAQAWEQVQAEMRPNAEKIQKEIDIRQGGYWEMTSHFALFALSMQTQSFVFYLFWRVISVMLIGMGLMKIGFFSGKLSFKTYGLFLIFGYGIAMPISGLGATKLIAADFAIPFTFGVGHLYDYLAGTFVSLAHVSLIVIIYKNGGLKWLTDRLAAVGRMAFTNYLMQSVVMGFIFFGVGLGLFGQLNRFPLLLFVLGMWVVQLIISPWWLKRFRFGPVEWLWRTLTYKKVQPMRK